MIRSKPGFTISRMSTITTRTARRSAQPRAGPMSSPEVLLDNAALLALINEDDVHHRATISVRNSLSASGATLVCSDWVLTEFLASAARPLLRTKAVGTVDVLRNSASVVVLEATRQQWDKAFEFYRSRPDKAWSLGDCN